ncbi:hypothetical protein UFOVP1336_25 [uncultured Caudovirales phage]|uniref:Uncharacterized protein n=1 Tax=uncultured Caudovirales phage TaxID=2100421 RepID=A0A6J5S222_9CAUD|nr:hypothetical protein UFOVP1336_25 [uncultured Caudovirales phage]
MKVELKIYHDNRNTDFGREYMGSVVSVDGEPAKLFAGASGSLIQIMSILSDFEVKKVTDGSMVTLLDGHDYLIGVALFYLHSRAEAAIFMDDRPTTLGDVIDHVHPNIDRKEQNV